MKYIYTKTGVVIDSPCEIKGENWELVEEKEPKKKPKSPVKQEVKDGTICDKARCNRFMAPING